VWQASHISHFKDQLVKNSLKKYSNELCSPSGMINNANTLAVSKFAIDGKFPIPHSG
jgi:hypothetical protein